MKTKPTSLIRIAFNVMGARVLNLPKQCTQYSYVRGGASFDTETSRMDKYSSNGKKQFYLFF